MTSVRGLVLLFMLSINSPWNNPLNNHVATISEYTTKCKTGSNGDPKGLFHLFQQYLIVMCHSKQARRLNQWCALGILYCLGDFCNTWDVRKHCFYLYEKMMKRTNRRDNGLAKTLTGFPSTTIQNITRYNCSAKTSELARLVMAMSKLLEEPGHLLRFSPIPRRHAVQLSILRFRFQKTVRKSRNKG
jgi:hypothetical protein